MAVTSKEGTWLDCWKTKEHNIPFLILDKKWNVVFLGLLEDQGTQHSISYLK